MFAKNKERQEEVQVEQEEEEREFHEKIEVVNDSSRNSELKGHYSKENVTAKRSEDNIGERSDLKIGKSI